MIRSLTLPALAVVVLALAADARAAWNPDPTSYTGSISSVRTTLSAWYGSGAQASSLPARSQRLLQKADAKLSIAQTVLGRTPGWSEYQKSLGALALAMRAVEKAARKAANVTSFQTVVYGTGGVGPTLAGLSRGLAVSAATYVNANFSSRRATRKLLRAGAHATRAQRLGNRTPPKYARALEQDRKVIRVLGRAGLL